MKPIENEYKERLRWYQSWLEINNMGKRRSASKRISPGNSQFVGLWTKEDLQEQKPPREGHFKDFNTDDNDENDPNQDLREFFNRTTLSGVAQIGTRRHIKWRLFWFLVSVAGLIMSFYQSMDVIIDYFEHRTTQVINYKNVRRSPFPSFTVCSNVRLLAKKINDNPDVREFCPESTCTRVTKSKKSMGQRDHEEILITDSLVLLQLNKSSEELTNEYYGNESNFIQNCFWKGVKCEMGNSDEILFFNTLLHGQCMTFNPGIHQGVEGADNRELHVILEMDRESRKLKFNDLRAIYWVHSPGTAPSLYTDSGGTIFPGDKIRIDFSVQNITRLESNGCVDPFEDDNQKLNVYFSEKVPYFYDQQSCIFYKQFLIWMERKCFYASQPKMPTYELFNVTSDRLCTTIDCLKNCSQFSDDDLDTLRRECKPSCKELSIQYNVNTMSLLLENLVEESLLDDSLASNIDVGASLARLGEELRNHTVAVIQVSPVNSYMEDIQEEPKYTVADFLGILGGNIGLWIGVSVISLAELVELVYIFVLVKIEDYTNRSRDTNDGAITDHQQGSPTVTTKTLVHHSVNSKHDPIVSRHQFWNAES